MKSWCVCSPEGNGITRLWCCCKWHRAAQQPHQPDSRKRSLRFLGRFAPSAAVMRSVGLLLVE